MLLQLAPTVVYQVPIPLSLLITGVVAIAGIILKMYITIGNTKKEVKDLTVMVEAQRLAVGIKDQALDDKISNVDKEVKSKLTEISTSLVKTNTLLELLLQGKIVINANNGESNK